MGSPHHGTWQNPGRWQTPSEHCPPDQGSSQVSLAHIPKTAPCPCQSPCRPLVVSLEATPLPAPSHPPWRLAILLSELSPHPAAQRGHTCLDRSVAPARSPASPGAPLDPAFPQSSQLAGAAFPCCSCTAPPIFLSTVGDALVALPGEASSPGPDALSLPPRSWSLRSSGRAGPRSRSSASHPRSSLFPATSSALEGAAVCPSASPLRPKQARSGRLSPPVPADP
mmetsp:Transcript_73429/g.172020  ORF Transcript_73429/g.172020 Transcript_73429/m.172020 type:complete len:225 (-) Transcript_73429:109-783(-)